MKIGHKIKNLRLQNNWTLEELGAKSNLSAGYLSQLERDLTTIGLDTLELLIHSFGITFEDFFKTNYTSTQIVKKNNYFTNTSPDYEVSWLTNDDKNKDMEPQLITLFSKKNSEIIKPFKGDVFGYVTEGNCTIHHDTYSEKIEKGDSFYLISEGNIWLENSGDKNCSVVWITTPPGF